MKHGVLLAAAALGTIALGPTARATYVFTYTPTSASVSGASVPASAVPGFVLTLTDAAVASGSFALDGFGSGNPPPPSWSGNLAGFVGMTVTHAFDGDITPGYLDGSLDISMSFTGSGQVSAANIRFLGVSEELQLNGGGSALSGYFGSDAAYCDSSIFSQKCVESGSLSVALPEPSSATLLLSGGAAMILGLLGSGRLLQRTLASRRS